jgi:hypothetical protein
LPVLMREPRGSSGFVPFLSPILPLLVILLSSLFFLFWIQGVCLAH